MNSQRLLCTQKAGVLKHSGIQRLFCSQKNLCEMLVLKLYGMYNPNLNLTAIGCITNYIHNFYPYNIQRFRDFIFHLLQNN